MEEFSVDFRNTTTLPSILSWKNESSIEKSYLESDQGLVVLPKSPCDYWQQTHYPHSYASDSAPFLSIKWNDYHIKEKDLVIQTRVSCESKHQYDQAGLYIRRNEGSWIKCSCEYEDHNSPSRLGAVVTNNKYSDWSTQDYAGRLELSFRMIKTGDDVVVLCNTDDHEAESKWQQIRIAHLFPLQAGAEDKIEIGIYACSPTKGATGFKAIFHYFKVFERPVISPHTL